MAKESSASCIAKAGCFLESEADDYKIMVLWILDPTCLIPPDFPLQCLYILDLVTLPSSLF